jgi:septal ring factor EnvC (AmiA/AmiB activator)
MIRFRLGFLLILAAGLHADTQQEIQAKQQQLEQIRQQKVEAQQEVRGQKLQEHSLLKELGKSDQLLNKSRMDLRTHLHNLSIVQSRLGEVAAQAKRCQDEIDLNHAMLRAELRSLYEAGPLKSMELLLSSKDPSELISRYHYLRALARHNQQRIDETRQDLVKLQDYQNQYAQKEAQIKSYKDQAELARRQALQEKRKRERMLAQVRQKKSRSEGLLKELDAAAGQLQDLIGKLGEEAAAAEARRRHGHPKVSGDLDEGPSKLGRRRSLPWPVKGRIISRFGQQVHPRFHTTVFNRGVEIAAPLGSPVVAVAAGTVRFADYFEGYGQMVILDHGGGDFSVYGYNSALSVKSGDEVAKGQPIAEVGDSSTLQRSALYFEIRRLAKAVDPTLWLR